MPAVERDGKGDARECQKAARKERRDTLLPIKYVSILLEYCISTNFINTPVVSCVQLEEKLAGIVVVMVVVVGY